MVVHWNPLSWLTGRCVCTVQLQDNQELQTTGIPVSSNFDHHLLDPNMAMYHHYPQASPIPHIPNSEPPQFASSTPSLQLSLTC